MNKYHNIIIKATDNFEIVLSRDAKLIFHVEDHTNEVIKITSYHNQKSANEHYKMLRKHYNLNKPTGRNAQKCATTDTKVIVVYADRSY